MTPPRHINHPAGIAGLTGPQNRAVEALRADGWMIFDPRAGESAAMVTKRAANLLYNLAGAASLTDRHRAQMREMCEELDLVTRAFGANPYSPAFRLKPVEGGDEHG